MKMFNKCLHDFIKLYAFPLQMKSQTNASLFSHACQKAFPQNAALIHLFVISERDFRRFKADQDTKAYSG